MDVTAQLQAHKNAYKSVEVEKPVPLDFDLGNLVAFDLNAVDESQLRTNPKDCLQNLARDGTQLLLNQIFNLPTTTTLEGVFAQLPEAVTVLPRAKPLPKPKPMTRWEKFAKTKGIQQTKKSRMAFDEATGEYRPRWGYKGTNNDSLEDWIKEVPADGDAMEDQYEKERAEKKERVAKNNKQQRRNLEEAAAREAGKNPREERKAMLKKQIVESKGATASMGRFDGPLRNESSIKIKRTTKRKFEPTAIDASKESESAMAVAQKVLKGDSAGVVNVNKAVHQLRMSKGGKGGAEKGGQKKRRVK
ncbi:Rhodanese- sulfurtransferase [Borealophlyctis nickersoniae]|nr:Rhodanese- sulfurtransferase [Borealophlyctis nickersoniae]